MTRQTHNMEVTNLILKFPQKVKRVTKDLIRTEHYYKLKQQMQDGH